MTLFRLHRYMAATNEVSSVERFEVSCRQQILNGYISRGIRIPSRGVLCLPLLFYVLTCNINLTAELLAKSIQIPL